MRAQQKGSPEHGSQRELYCSKCFSWLGAIANSRGDDYYFWVPFRGSPPPPPGVWDLLQPRSLQERPVSAGLGALVLPTPPKVSAPQPRGATTCIASTTPRPSPALL
eukprot:gene24035-biopygen8909